jgi:putative tryptophan/tyrosine transport system substrate-binding protein
VDRRTFAKLIGAALALVPVFGQGQQPGKVWSIGFLGSESASGFASRVEALRAGLRDLGYVEGKNIVIEYRWAEGNYDRLSYRAPGKA